MFNASKLSWRPYDIKTIYPMQALDISVPIFPFIIFYCHSNDIVYEQTCESFCLRVGGYISIIIYYHCGPVHCVRTTNKRLNKYF